MEKDEGLMCEPEENQRHCKKRKMSLDGLENTEKANPLDVIKDMAVEELCEELLNINFPKKIVEELRSSKIDGILFLAFDEHDLSDFGVYGANRTKISMFKNGWRPKTIPEKNEALELGTSQIHPLSLLCSSGVNEMTVEELREELRKVGVREKLIQKFYSSKVDGKLFGELGYHELKHIGAGDFDRKQLEMFKEGWRPKRSTQANQEENQENVNGTNDWESEKSEQSDDE